MAKSKYHSSHYSLGVKSLVYHISIGKLIERHKYYCVSNKYSVFMMLIIVTTLLVGVASVYQPAEAEMQLLQLQPPLPPLPPPGLPPIDLPGLPPIQSPSQQQSPGGSIVR
jgi:hypothetical protein